MSRDENGERQVAVFSASHVLDEIATALTTIRRDDGLTFDDMAAVLGKSPDMAAKYCAGSATMDVVTYARAKREWNGRFTGGLHRLCSDSRPVQARDRSCQSSILKAALAMSEALEDDDEVCREEVRKNRATLENARDAIEAQLAKLSPVAARK
jgi:hypothetical protein